MKKVITERNIKTEAGSEKAERKWKSGKEWKNVRRLGG